MRKIVRQFQYMGKWIQREFSRKTLSVHSAHVVFFLMVSFFPFVMFFFSLLRHTPLVEDNILMLLDQYLPGTLNHVLSGWIHEAYTKSSGTRLSLAALATVWAGSRGFIGITSGLDKIYGAGKPRNWFVKRFYSFMYTLAFAIVLLISLIVFVYGSRILATIDSYSPIETPWYIGISSLRPILGFVIFYLFFLLMYAFLPERKPQIKSETPGAFFTSAMWIIFSYLFSIYIDHFTNYASIYGSFTYIVLFMLWMYVCMNILFIGALINQFIAKHRSE
nr:YihY/virulence factor BrkB family protein [Eubacterium sp.]